MQVLTPSPLQDFFGTVNLFYIGYDGWNQIKLGGNSSLYNNITSKPHMFAGALNPGAALIVQYLTKY